MKYTPIAHIHLPIEFIINTVIRIKTQTIHLFNKHNVIVYQSTD